MKKCAKTYVKKPKNAQKCAQRYLAGAKMNADRWFIEECGVLGSKIKLVVKKESLG